MTALSTANDSEGKNTMKCFFCKQHVNEKRKTTFYAHVQRKNGTYKKVRWCKSCDETKATEIDNLLKENE